MRLVRSKPLLSLFLLALGLRLSVYIVVNYLVFGGELEHPDSYYYFEKGQTYGILWRTGDLSGLFSFKYQDFLGILFVWLPHSRLVPELVNILASSLTVVLGYLIILRAGADWQGNLGRRRAQAAFFVALLLAIDPYLVYLSTQILKESLYLFGLALLMYGLVSSSRKFAFIGLLGLLSIGVLRFQVTLFLIIPVFSYVFISRLPRFPLPRASLIFLLAPMVAFLLGWSNNGSVSGVLSWASGLRMLVSSSTSETIYLAEEEYLVRAGTLWGSEAIAEWESISPERLEILRNGVPTFVYEGEVRPPVQHREFFSPRRAIARSTLLSFSFTPLELLSGIADFLTFPRPWDANSRLEFAFIVYMLYWYGVLVVLVLGLASWRRTWPVLLLGLVLGSLVVLTTSGPGPIVRYRLAGFFLLILVAGPALAIIPSPKRIFDVVVASSFLLVLSPVLLLIALSLKLTTGQIFFSQTRIGLEGQAFVLHKFTSMIPDSDTRVVAETTDPRITKLGRLLRTTSLDEAPQLFDVLRGNMSIVGPRPHAIWDLPSPPIPNWNLRQAILPGLIGLAQLNSDRNDYTSKLKWDLEYIARHSIWLDTKLLLVGLQKNLTRRWV